MTKQHGGCRGAGGRHAFIFMRHVNTWGYLGLQIFCGLPFIYELRAVLDWSCTPTTLKLFDWLKLEDISTSLYFVTCDRYGREGRQLGQRQPRYMKFCQVSHPPLLLHCSAAAACQPAAHSCSQVQSHTRHGSCHLMHPQRLSYIALYMRVLPICWCYLDVPHQRGQHIPEVSWLSWSHDKVVCQANNKQCGAGCSIVHPPAGAAVGASYCLLLGQPHLQGVCPPPSDVTSQLAHLWHPCLACQGL